LVPLTSLLTPLSLTGWAASWRRRKSEYGRYTSRQSDSLLVSSTDRTTAGEEATSAICTYLLAFGSLSLCGMRSTITFPWYLSSGSTKEELSKVPTLRAEGSQEPYIFSRLYWSISVRRGAELLESLADCNLRSSCRVLML